eukprot:343272_1
MISHKKDDRFLSMHTNVDDDSDHHPYQLNDFNLHETVGTGTFGRVRLVQSLLNLEWYVLKVMKKATIVRLKQVTHIKNEITLLRTMDHPGLVKMCGMFQTDENLYLVLEYINGGELFSHLRSAVRFPNHQAMIYTADVVNTFDYLHSKDIVYRDLKPENLLITKEGRIKITDFGFAKVVVSRTWTLCGTPEYLAPEIIQSKGHGKGVDWWALGILIYEMLAGYPPFYDEQPVGIYQKILSGRFEMPKSFNEYAKDIIKRFLTEDRTRRLGCTKGGGLSVRAHKWFSGLDWQALADGKGTCVGAFCFFLEFYLTILYVTTMINLFCLSHLLIIHCYS